jgi:hypothetical protein
MCVYTKVNRFCIKKRIKDYSIRIDARFLLNDTTKKTIINYSALQCRIFSSSSSLCIAHVTWNCITFFLFVRNQFYADQHSIIFFYFQFLFLIQIVCKSSHKLSFSAEFFILNLFSFFIYLVVHILILFFFYLSSNIFYAVRYGISIFSFFSLPHLVVVSSWFSSYFSYFILCLLLLSNC